MLPSPGRFTTAFATIQALPPDPYEATIFRVVPLRPFMAPPMAGTRILYDEGPVRNSYRYTPHPTFLPPAPFQPNPLRNPPYPVPYQSGYSFRALYTAEDPLTAYRECHQQQWPLFTEQSFTARFRLTVMLGAQVSLQPVRVLDLTRLSVRRLLRTSLQQLTGNWRLGNQRGRWAPTQLLGYEAFRSGLFDAIRFPSARNPGGVCLLIFTERAVAVGPWYIRVDDRRPGDFMDTGLFDEILLP